MIALVLPRPAGRTGGGGGSRFWRRAALLAVAVWLAAAGLSFAAPKFPPLTGRVVDDAGVLSPQTEAQLTTELADLEAKTGRQMVVATIPDLQGLEIEDYGYQLGRAWGIGDKDRDDGVVFLVAPKDRKVRIEVGYGLEPVLTDALSNVILQREVLPAFRDGNIEAGVVAGTRALEQQLALPDDQARAMVAKASQAKPAGHEAPAMLIFYTFLIFWILGGVLRAFAGGRRGGLGGLWYLPLVLLSGRGGGGWSGGGGGGGFSGGGGSFGGGGSSGSW
jgi:uncharacterized protein